MGLAARDIQMLIDGYTGHSGISGSCSNHGFHSIIVPCVNELLDPLDRYREERQRGFINNNSHLDSLNRVLGDPIINGIINQNGSGLFTGGGGGYGAGVGSASATSRGNDVDDADSASQKSHSTGAIDQRAIEELRRRLAELASETAATRAVSDKSRTHSDGNNSGSGVTTDTQQTYPGHSPSQGVDSDSQFNVGIPLPPTGGEGGSAHGSHGFQGPTQTKTIDDILGDMHKGTASLSAPTEAEEYEKFTVTLTLSAKDLETFERDEPAAPGTASTTVGNVRMSNKMRAEFVGPDFTIDSHSELEQLVTEKENTIWTWIVHSDSFGSKDKIISARLYVLVKLPGDTTDTPRSIRVADLPIKVHLNPVGWTEHHWEWLWTALLVPIGTYLYKRLGGGDAPTATQPRRFAFRSRRQ